MPTTTAHLASLFQKLRSFIQIVVNLRPVIFTTIGNGRDVKNIQDHGRKKNFATRGGW